MKLNAALGIFFVLVAAKSAYAKEWRGIVPLRSTRADVVRLLNQCSDQKEACRFKLEKEEVYILFSSGLESEYVECAKRFAPETVMFIEVQPVGKLRFKDLRLDKKKLKSFDFGRSLKGYVARDGLAIRTLKEEILQLDYFADETDMHLCSKYYENPESFVEVIYVHVPGVYMLGPDSARAGEALIFRAYADITKRRGFEWSLSAGRIVTGQYTKSITVDTTGLEGQTIVVSAEIGDGLGHYVTGSRTVQILKN